MKKRYYFFIFFILFNHCLLAYANDIVNNEKFFIGINGHPLNQEGYLEIGVNEQIKLLKELNINWYRVDVSDNFKELSQLYEICNKNKINILPVIFPPIDLLKENNLDLIYEKSYNYSLSLSREFNGKINYWELDNELSNFAIMQKNDKYPNGQIQGNGTPHGNNSSDYNQEKYNKVKYLLKGLSDGIHKGNPKAKRIINAGWLHYGFIEKLIKDHIEFEIIGWHWYSDMGQITSVFGNINVLNELNKLNKDIWITEANFRGGSIRGDLSQSKYIQSTIEEMKSLYPIVKSYFIYELLDEPYFGLDNSESFYGLVEIKREKDKGWKIFSKKNIFEFLKSNKINY